MARHTPFISLFALVGAAACTQPQVEVVDKGGLYFGQNQVVQVGSFVPAQQQPMIAAKYKGSEYAEPTPAVAVEVADLGEPMDVATLDAPEPIMVQEVETLAPLEVSFAGDMESLAPLPIQNTTQAIVNPVANSTFSWPVEGPVLSHYGPKAGGLVNDGINIAAGSGEPIWAAAGGEVAYAGSSVADYGNMVIVRHSNGWMSAYGHASDLLVKKGDVVKQGDLLGYVGQTGNVSEPQLHFGLRKNDKPVDPLSLLPHRVASIN